MTDISHVSRFITALTVHYRIKHESPETGKAWMASMSRALGRFNAEVLEKAAQEIIDTRTKTFMPLPGECVEACDRVAKRLDSGKRTSMFTERKTHHKDIAQSIAQDFLLETPLGRQATHEGWGMDLKGIVRTLAARHLAAGKGVALDDIKPDWKAHGLSYYQERAAKFDPQRLAYERWRASGFPPEGPDYPPGWEPKGMGAFEGFLRVVRKRMEGTR